MKQKVHLMRLAKKFTIENRSYKKKLEIKYLNLVNRQILEHSNLTKACFSKI